MLHNACLLIDDIEDNSTLRDGVPVAHLIYGTPLTINTSNYIYFLAMQKVFTLDHPHAINIFAGRLQSVHVHMTRFSLIDCSY
jgi:geranylgeranyl diphosphate synthase, type III